MDVLMTPDGKHYVYVVTQVLSNLFVVEELN